MQRMTKSLFFTTSAFFETNLFTPVRYVDKVSLKLGLVIKLE